MKEANVNMTEDSLKQIAGTMEFAISKTNASKQK